MISGHHNGSYVRRMSETPDGPWQDGGRYDIRFEGRVDPRWATWFDGLTLTYDGADTVVHGPVADQAALHGLLRKVRDLGLRLVSVNRVEPDPLHDSTPDPSPTGDPHDDHR